ncbi:MAG: hypothetical protein A2W99_16790 [Bacteroidetes bacterium GWF2_33_16]|nr:MAG: hypothetical protein A2X00_14005 [Bacteroidetes bacterium GWE2_32_14]OFY03405.1 MAG: hypothetical protein A2W99_16790 [Bacteroidetes bacterium GWF2_33_16]
MKKDLLYYIVVFIIILLISGSSFVLTKWFTIGFTTFLLVIFLNQKREFTKKIFLVLVVWFLINILAMFFTNSDFILLRILHYTFGLLLLPYFVISLMGLNFWSRFERIVYFLTLVSIPLFALNIVFPDFFNSLSSLFRPLTRDIFSKFNTDTNYWSALIYVNAIKDGSFYRNSGFMWEPGSFAMIIVWAIVYNWLTKGIKFDKRFWVYFTAMATTLSTAGYLAIFVVILSNYIKKIGFKNIVLLPIIAFLFWTYIYQLDFVGGEIDYYIEGYSKDNLFYNNSYEAIKVSRFQIVKYDFYKVFEHPFGYGVVSKKDFSEEIEIVGVNGLTNLMVMWGIPVFIFMLVLMKRYVFLLNFRKYSNLTLYFLFTGLLIMFFSNPLSRNVFIYLIMITPLLINFQHNTNATKPTS